MFIDPVEIKILINDKDKYVVYLSCYDEKMDVTWVPFSNFTYAPDANGFYPENYGYESPENAISDVKKFFKDNPPLKFFKNIKLTSKEWTPGDPVTYSSLPSHDMINKDI